MELVLIWGKFFLLLVLVLIFGDMAARSADVLAEKKGWTQAFMGVFFISMITSFPELFTGISAGAIVQSPDIAVGQIMGSCVFNIFIIGIIELFFRKKNIYAQTGKLSVTPVYYSLLLVTLATLLLSIGFKWRFFHVGYSSILLFIVYLVFMYSMFKERKVEDADSTDPVYKDKKISVVLAQFILSALIIIGVGIYLPIVGKQLAVAMNWNDSFVGVIFLAMVTSFPELVVSISAARIGAVEMLLGNLTGSNLFNIAIILIIDIAYVKGNVMTSVGADQVSVGLVAVLMNVIVLFAVIRRSSFRLLNIISINGILLILLYLINLMVVY